MARITPEAQAWSVQADQVPEANEDLYGGFGDNDAQPLAYNGRQDSGAHPFKPLNDTHSEEPPAFLAATGGAPTRRPSEAPQASSTPKNIDGGHRRLSLGAAANPLMPTHNASGSSLRDGGYGFGAGRTSVGGASDGDAKNSPGAGQISPSQRSNSIQARRISQSQLGSFQQGSMGEGSEARSRPNLASAMLRSYTMGSGAQGNQSMNALSVNSQSASNLQVVSQQPLSSAASGGEYTSEERHAAESQDQLFMPSLQREQFIPVRVARDKIKQALAEMAAMRTQHLAALETMERQHQFLKAQLEAATATYVKKLTQDYNTRVATLESEYQKRFAGVNGSAMTVIQSQMEDAKKRIEAMEAAAMARVKESEVEFEQERRMFYAKVEHERRQVEQLAAEARAGKEETRKYQQRIAELETQLMATSQSQSQAAEWGGIGAAIAQGAPIGDE